MSIRKSEVKHFFKLLKNIDLGGGVNAESLSQMIKNETPYKIPRNYIQWEDISDLIAITIANSKQIISRNKESDNVGLLNCAKMAYEFIENKAPVFVVSSDLINVILNSSVLDENVDFFAKLLESIEVIYPSLLLLFPRDCFALADKQQKSFGSIDHCFITLNEGNKNATTRVIADDGEHIVSHDISIHWGAITTKGNIVDQFININRGGNLSGYTPQLKNIKDDDGGREMFNLLQVVIQCLLLISSKPDLLITTENESSQCGFLPKKDFKTKEIKQSVKKVFPRVLNLEYTEKVVKEGDNNLKGRGSRSPKRPHWRLGYTVNKPIGKMKGIPSEQWERKLITIKPYLVRGNTDQGDCLLAITSPNPGNIQKQN